MKSEQPSRVTLNEVSKAIGSPVAFTSKILQKLCTAGIISSVKGIGGGYELSTEKNKTTRLKHIIEAIDGESLVGGCFLGLKQCSDSDPCPVHHMYAPIRELLNTSLLDISLYDINYTKGNLS